MLDIRMLGELRVYVDGREADLGHAKQRCVLAALLVDANRTVALDVLADRVWGQDPPRTFAATIRSYVSRLRTTLPATDGWAIERRSGGYAVRVHDLAVDLHRFRDLVRRARPATDESEQLPAYRRALALWRGDAFADLDGVWPHSVREALRDEYLAATLDYHDIRLRRGEHAAMLAELTVLAREYPLDERVAGQLMSALYGSGRQADALRHYDRVRRELADELGVDPGPGLRRLHQDMLTGDLPDSTPAARESSRRRPPCRTPRDCCGAGRDFPHRQACTAACRRTGGR